MSASINPTRAPCLPRAQARFTATVDFPTPPLPLLMAMVCLTVGIRLSLLSAGPVPAAPAGLTSPIHFPFFSFRVVTRRQLPYYTRPPWVGQDRPFSPG